MDTTDAGSPAPRQRRFPAAALVGSGLVAGLVLAGLTAANAQSDPSPSPGATAPGAPDLAHPGKGRGPGGPGGPGGRGFGGLGPGLGNALHGEFSTKDADGGYRTLAVQRGTVTQVSATSIAVRSEDGFARTYAVGDDTTVVSANDGIGDVATGDVVHVLAEVSGDDATAVRIVDVTEAGRLRERWGLRGDKRDRRAPAASPSPS